MLDAEEDPGSGMEVTHQDQLASVPEEASSFGEVLRRERQLRGFTLQEISGATKISMRHLEALESNDFPTLPGGVFNKGFLRAYATFIGLDAEEMINHYLYELSLQHRQTRPQGDGRRRSRRLLLASGLLMLVMLLMLAWLALGP